jgi:hydroxymethylpyrimidine pyrophosphatase-like HAD family hydrolase
MAKLKLADIKFGGTYKMKTDQFQGYGYSKGDAVQIVYLAGNNIQIKDPANPHSQQCAVQVSQLDFYLQSKEQIESNIATAKALIKREEDKLLWMQATNNEEFDEDEFKVWSTLQVFKDTKMTDVDKAKAIAAMIKSS